MAPRKNKTQGKRNIKIKSKVNSRKREPKSGKKLDPKLDKPLTNLKWLNKAVADGSVKKTQVLPDWLRKSPFKRSTSNKLSETNVSEFGEYPQRDVEEKSSASEVCNCSPLKYIDSNKGGILKSTVSSNSLLSKYIKSGMSTVASFIVESAIRFGEQHGVVVPDKDAPNVYEITPSDNRYADKYRKIRFKVPDKVNYEDAKKLMWKNYAKSLQHSEKKRAQTPVSKWEGSVEKKSWPWERTPDSLEEIIPLLEKLKGGENISNDPDLEKLRKPSNENSAKLRDRDRDWERERERERGRSRERERDRNRFRNSDRDKERLREKLRTLRKRYKSLGGVPVKDSEDKNLKSEWNRWKKCKRDSVELGRQRMRATTCPRKQNA